MITTIYFDENDYNKIYNQVKKSLKYLKSSNQKFKDTMRYELYKQAFIVASKTVDKCYVIMPNGDIFVFMNGMPLD